MDKVSIIIPARNEPFLSKTVDSLIKNATGEIEVIAVMADYKEDPELRNHKDLIAVRMGSVVGMRSLINAGVRISSGKYLMKIDAHCMVGKGFDEILKADCDKHWVSIPSRYSLDVEKWERFRGPVDYLYLTYPYDNNKIYGTGFHGIKWRGEHGLTGSFWHKERERKKILIDDLLSFQGSCWFMHKDHYYSIDGLESDKYNEFFQEAQEIGFKTWLSGGRVIRNKKTWYAHLHKGPKHKIDYGLSARLKAEGELFCMDMWMHNKWYKQTKDLKWLIKKFGPLEGWPKDWDNPKYFENYEHPWVKKKRLHGRKQSN